VERALLVRSRKGSAQQIPGRESLVYRDVMIPAKEAMQGLVGHRFPGGQYKIEHWENFLLSEATGIEPLPDSLAHPVHLFHVPINGVGTSITELFALAEVDGASPVSIDYYDWSIYTPIREDETYSLSGGITAYERKEGPDGPTVDSFTYEIDMTGEGGNLAAHVAFRWHYWRLGS
jgi:hypothetical protein